MINTCRYTEEFKNMFDEWGSNTQTSHSSKFKTLKQLSVINRHERVELPQ